MFSLQPYFQRKILPHTLYKVSLAHDFMLKAKQNFVNKNAHLS